LSTDAAQTANKTGLQLDNQRKTAHAMHTYILKI